ncbi:hypothetical protein IGI37_001114 [Enterococcus sp. AZ194]
MFNKRLFPPFFIVPVLFVAVTPTIFILILRFTPSFQVNVDQLRQLVPSIEFNDGFQMNIIRFLINSVLPIFFIFIPVRTSSIMSASSFVGEKEKRILEILLYSPLTLKEIFLSKIVISLIISMFICLLSFLLMLLVFQMDLMFLMNENVSLDLFTWLITLHRNYS